MIKAVFIDIDDTLINSNREITQKTLKEIKKCVKKEIKIILASGRSRKEAIEYQELIGASPYIISSNGASCYDKQNEKEIYNNFIPKEIVKKIFLYSEKNNYKLKLNYKDKLVLNKTVYPDEKDKVKNIDELKQIINKEQIVQCVICDNSRYKMLKFKNFLEKNLLDVKIVNQSKSLQNISLKPSKNYFYDITSKQSSKGNAVTAICNYLNLKKEEIITIGDGENDISMLLLTPNSVAMGNAIEKVKSISNYQTLTNDEDGVAKILEIL